MASDEAAAALARGAFAWKALPNGRIADVVLQLHGYALVAVMDDFDRLFSVYGDVWQYQSLSSAMTAFADWDGDGEPTGWYRHPASGRRRPDGDAAREFVRE